MSFSPTSQWFTQNESERKSLQEFQCLVGKSTLPLEEIYKAIQDASLPFGTRGVLPFQCRKAIKSLFLLKTQLTQCSQLLRETSLLPVVILALRYQLLDEISYLEEQAEKLMYFIENYTSNCMSATQKAASQEQAIQECFEKLLHLLSNMPTQVSFLFDEALFQEKRLASVTS
jgi:hypothetical protein